MKNNIKELTEQFEDYFCSKVEDQQLMKVLAHQCATYCALKKDIEADGVTLVTKSGIVKSHPNIYCCKSIGELILKLYKELQLTGIKNIDELELQLKG
jgi:hypothetical protein